MTGTYPVGNTRHAYVTALARARKAENRVRELRAENENLRAQIDTQEDQ